jgi:hypothetical protein
MGSLGAQPEPCVWATVAACPVEASATVQVPRRGAQPPRTASLAVPWCPLTLGPPRHRTRESLPTVQVWAVQALEEMPPAGADPIEWWLLTTWAVHTTAEVLERLDWYACHWGVEVWQSMLKSGCRSEARQGETAERLQRCLPLSSVIAWRIFSATMLSRVVPEAPYTAILELEEWQALSCAIHRTPTPPPEPPSLRQAVHWIAQLVALWAAGAMANPGPPCCGKAFSSWPTLQPCTVSCALPPQSEKMWVKHSGWTAGDDEMGRPYGLRRRLAALGERSLLAVPSNTAMRDLETASPESSGRGMSLSGPGTASRSGVSRLMRHPGRGSTYAMAVKVPWWGRPCNAGWCREPIGVSKARRRRSW